MSTLLLLVVLAFCIAPTRGGVVACVNGTNQGCANGGICYLNPTIGYICSCPYGWYPPTCSTPYKPSDIPICNTDYSPTAGPQPAWPACQYCQPGNNTHPDGNGCRNYGVCNVRKLIDINYTAGLLAPPGTEFPICSCPTGWVSPDCRRTLYDYFGRSQVYHIKYLYMSIFIILLFVGGFLFYLHLSFHEDGERSRFQKQQMRGLVLVMLSCLCMVFFWGMNTFGVQQGGYNYAWYAFQHIFLFFSIGLLVTSMAIITGIWLSVAFVSAQRAGGIPWLADALAAIVGFLILSTSLAMAIILPYGFETLKWVFLYDGITMAITCTFIIISGIVVLVRISDSGAATKNTARQKRMAVQLILVAIVEFLGLIVLNILAFLPVSLFTAFDPYYFSEVFLPTVVQFIVIGVLYWFFRRTDLSSSKLKDNLKTRGGTTTSKNTNIASDAHSGIGKSQVDPFADDGGGSPGASEPAVQEL